jgi:hypothetical protein
MYSNIHSLKGPFEGLPNKTLQHTSNLFALGFFSLKPLQKGYVNSILHNTTTHKSPKVKRQMLTAGI